jgi:hypothetical protein
VIEDARARQRRHRFIGVVVLLAAAAAIGMLILATGGGGGGGAAAARNPARLAAQQPPTIAPAGEYSYLDELSVQTGPRFRENVRWWVAPNGSGRVASTMRVDGGRPQSFSETFGARGYDSVAYPLLTHLVGRRVIFPIGSLVPLDMSFDPERLPTAPTALGHALRADVAKAAQLQRHGIYAERNTPQATKELLLIANALQDPMDTPALRSALFATARKLPGIAVQHGVTDPLGRRGEAISMAEGVAVEADGQLNRSAQETFAVIVNPKTRKMLAETQYPSDHPAQADNSYTAFTGPVDATTDIHP